MSHPDRPQAGASARAIYRSRLASTRARRLSIRAALALGAGALGWWLLDWRAGLVLAAAAALADWLYRWRTHSPTVAWRKGAAGERATARRLRDLERAGYIVLHDRALPRTKANVDHLVIGACGVFVVDSKKWDRRTRISGSGGRLWIGRRPADRVVRSLAFETRTVAEVLRRATGTAVTVIPVVAVHGARLPRWGAINVGGITLLRAARLHGWITRHPRRYSPTEVEALGAVAAAALPPATG